MADSMFGSAFHTLGWYFLPTQATSILQSFYYRLTYPVGRRHPQPGEPIYAHHHRRIRILVLCLYLVYVLAQALYDVKLAGDFYTALGVTPSSSEREVKSRFRRLAAIFHPDKVREQDIPEDAFVKLKLAQDTILDPAKKFAYDRFGPAVVQVNRPGLKTTTDYVYLGLRSKMPEYFGNAVMLVVLNYVWLSKWGQFWRYYAVAVMAFLELYFLTHAWTPPTVLAKAGAAAAAMFPQLLPQHLLPFQILAVARKLSMSLNIFISQLAPPSAKNVADPSQQTLQHMAHLSQVATRVDDEATGLLQLQMAPFRGNTREVHMLRDGMRESLITNAVRSNPEVQKAVEDALSRRQAAAEAGLDRSEAYVE